MTIVRENKEKPEVPFVFLVKMGTGQIRSVLEAFVDIVGITWAATPLAIVLAQLMLGPVMASQDTSIFMIAGVIALILPTVVYFAVFAQFGRLRDST